MGHVGRSCRAPVAQVHRAELRIQADYSLVQNRLHEFKANLANILETDWLTPAQVHPSRVAITHVRAGSVIVELTVLPSAHSLSSSVGPTPATSIARLREYMESSDLQQKICATT